MMNNIKHIKNRVCLIIFALGVSMIGLHELDSNFIHHERAVNNKAEVNITINVKEI